MIIGEIKLYEAFGFVMITLGFMFFFFACLIIFRKGVERKIIEKETEKLPTQEVHAEIITKRVHYMNLSWYYITFEFADGQRKEFQVSGEMYGLFTEKDKGTLRYKGNKFVAFILD